MKSQILNILSEISTNPHSESMMNDKADLIINLKYPNVEQGVLNESRTALRKHIINIFKEISANPPSVSEINKKADLIVGSKYSYITNVTVDVLNSESIIIKPLYALTDNDVQSWTDTMTIITDYAGVVNSQKVAPNIPIWQWA